MKLLEGKNPTERNKIIAAAVLGLVALVALYFAFGRPLLSSGTATATAKSSPTPTPGPTNKTNSSLPTVSEQDYNYQITPVVYQPGNAYAPDPGRNIFAFYEPAIPCKGDQCPPSPVPSPPAPKPPSPTPTAPIILASVNPQNVYAGSTGFRLEVTGERFTPDAHIYFSQSELPTTFINEGKIVADIPANFIAQEGPRQIIVQTPDGKAYSNQMMLSVQAPPKPTLMYIGMIGRKRYNNDTAYFMESEKATPFGARLNDVLNNRFRLVDISPVEVVFQDVNLGFRHRVPISKSAFVGGPGGPGGPGGAPGKGGFPGDGGFQPNPGTMQQNEIPGIPNNVQRFNPAEQKKLDQQQKKDVDDNDDGDG